MSESTRIKIYKGWFAVRNINKFISKETKKKKNISQNKIKEINTSALANIVSAKKAFENGPVSDTAKKAQ